jgi:hypothetical protein
MAMILFAYTETSITFHSLYNYHFPFLGAWSIWKHCKRCVFDGISSSLSGVLLLARGELYDWSWAGARGISFLLALVLNTITLMLI